MPKPLTRVLASALAVGPAGPPTSFRIFGPGVNATSKGDFVFDAAAARSVMAVYRRAGVDLVIDLEHESLGPRTRADSGDARGWAKLELRADGSLWAVDVRWTPDGARRLKDRTQKYISPAFLHETSSGRITELINMGLVAMPATYEAYPLAASRSGVVSTRLTNDQVQAVRALANRSGFTTAEFLRRTIAVLTAPAVVQIDEKGAKALLRTIARALGLKLDTDPLVLVDAVRQAVEALQPVSQPEAAQEAALSALTPAERAYCARFGLSLDKYAAHFAAAKARAARRS
jgi:phage I-like protein